LPVLIAQLPLDSHCAIASQFTVLACAFGAATVIDVAERAAAVSATPNPLTKCTGILSAVERE
jgi:hypothetical protein